MSIDTESIDPPADVFATVLQEARCTIFGRTMLESDVERMLRYIHARSGASLTIPAIKAFLNVPVKCEPNLATRRALKRICERCGIPLRHRPKKAKSESTGVLPFRDIPAKVAKAAMPSFEYLVMVSPRGVQG